MKLLVVIDMQNDFIDGALGTPEAMHIVEPVKNKIATYKAKGDVIIYTFVRFVGLGRKGIPIGAYRDNRTDRTLHRYLRHLKCLDS